MNPEFLSDLVADPKVQAFSTAFPITLLHTGLMLAVLLAASTLYALITPYKEISQIREGNGAAAVAFGGVIIGLAIPLAMSLSAQASSEDIAIWGGATALLQLLFYRLTDFVLVGLPGRVQEGEVPAAVLMVAAKLAVSFILAAAVAG